MQKAIIHSLTRVIRRLTTEDNPALSTGEEVVVLDAPIDLAGGYWKLDSQNKKTLATDQESKDAGVNEAFNESERIKKRQLYKNTVSQLAESDLTLDMVKQYFIVLRDLL